VQPFGISVIAGPPDVLLILFSKPLHFIAPLAVLICASLIRAEQAAEMAEKVSDVSPDGKYGMRITYDRTLNQQMTAANNTDSPDHIHTNSIEKVELVALPGKTSLVNLMPDQEELNGAEGLRLMWSGDSHWVALHWSYPRYSHTTVYRLGTDGKFVPANKRGTLKVKTNEDVRNQYVEAVRWIQPGTLELRQETILRSEEGGADFQFTVKFDGKGGFKIVSKKVDR
jgi:hypothetical protein